MGEAEAHVDHEKRRTPAGALRPAEACEMDHAGAAMPSPARTRASASSGASRGDQRSGLAGTGGASPLSALHVARNSSSGGPESNPRAPTPVPPSPAPSGP